MTFVYLQRAFRPVGDLSLHHTEPLHVMGSGTGSQGLVGPFYGMVLKEGNTVDLQRTITGTIHANPLLCIYSFTFLGTACYKQKRATKRPVGDLQQ